LNCAVAGWSKDGIGTRLDAVEFRTTTLGVKHRHKREAFMVKKTINALACALIAQLAFAQTSTTTKEQKTSQRTTPRKLHPAWSPPRMSQAK
jgi:hypothetical protein